MMQTAIENFAKQFSFQPKIENKKNLKKCKKFVVLGMGGSHLAADLLKIARPELPLIIHSDYGLPSMDKKTQKEHLFIASSYSGNTEEVIEGLKEAHKKHLPLLVIAVGGKLIELAKKHSLPYIEMPDTGIQPRSALGFSLLAMLLAIGENKALREAQTLAKILSPKSFQKAGEELAKRIEGKVPLIYSSRKNFAIAYNWKIKLNETGKIPAFYNVLPELNHNEMNGFDVKEKTKKLSDKFYFLFLTDKTDHPQIQKRMKVAAKLYADRSLPSEMLELKGKTIWHKIFSSLLLADWAAVSVAGLYGLEAEQVPMIEEFKKLIEK
jgi:glucose/mannose-6-phosphate isomerase